MTSALRRNIQNNGSPIMTRPVVSAKTVAASDLAISVSDVSSLLLFGISKFPNSKKSIQSDWSNVSILSASKSTFLPSTFNETTPFSNPTTFQTHFSFVSENVQPVPLTQTLRPIFVMHIFSYSIKFLHLSEFSVFEAFEIWKRNNVPANRTKILHIF